MFKRLVIGIALVGLTEITSAQELNIFRNGDVADAEKLNENFERLHSEIMAIPAGPQGEPGPTGPAGANARQLFVVDASNVKLGQVVGLAGTTRATLVSDQGYLAVFNVSTGEFTDGLGGSLKARKWYTLENCQGDVYVETDYVGPGTVFVDLDGSLRYVPLNAVAVPAFQIQFRDLEKEDRTGCLFTTVTSSIPEETYFSRPNDTGITGFRAATDGPYKIVTGESL